MYITPTSAAVEPLHTRQGSHGEGDTTNTIQLTLSGDPTCTFIFDVLKHGFRLFELRCRLTTQPRARKSSQTSRTRAPNAMNSENDSTRNLLSIFSFHRPTISFSERKIADGMTSCLIGQAQNAAQGHSFEVT